MEMNSDRNFGKYPEISVQYRYIADNCKKNPKFLLTDYQKDISCRYSPMHEIPADIFEISIFG